MISGYGKVYALGHRSIREIFNGPVTVQEKVDGCVSGSSLVSLDDGSKIRVDTLYRHVAQADTRVSLVSYDENKQQFVSSNLSAMKRDKSSSKDFINIYTERKGQRGIPRKKMVVSKNHPLLTQRGWVEAGCVIENKDAVLVENIFPDYVTQQYIRGSVMGDASLSNPKDSKSRFSTGHCDEQKELIDFAEKVLSPYGNRLDSRTSGYGSNINRIHTRGHDIFTKLYNDVYISGVKTITKQYLDSLDPIALAFWYMDDGSRSNATGQRDRVCMHTCAHSKEENQLLQEWLFEKWKLDSSLSLDKRKKGYYSIRLTTDSSQKFFYLVAPYILPALRYKLPTNLQHVGCFWDNYELHSDDFNKSELVVLSKADAEDNANEQHKWKYDLEVEDTHSFVINDFVVHNSQISFARLNGELHVRSRGAALDIWNPQKLFALAVEYLRENYLLLEEGYIYRGECVTAPRHNVLVYDRIPKNGIALFDIETEPNNPIVDRHKLELEAKCVGLEVVPEFNIEVSSKEDVLSLLENESFLGGPKIEGVVVKNYNQFGRDSRFITGKYVSEAFKEIHKSDWQKLHGTDAPKDIITKISDALSTEARWNKAIQHLREEGKLQDMPQDIPVLISEIQADINEECEEIIKDKLFKWAMPQIRRRVTRGFPEYYKESLLDLQDYGTEK